MATRREFLGTTLLASTAFSSFAQAAAKSDMLRRPIPATGELVPAIGMGTSGSFQIPANGAEYQALKEVVKRFFEGGATLIDTAPTYGNAEDNLGSLLAEGGYRKKAFIATKLSGVSGRDAGLEQFNNTLRRLRTDKVELLQVHNLRDWTFDRHRTTDDRPFGGGEGMVMKAEPVFRAVESILPARTAGAKVVLLSAQGRRFDQAAARALADLDEIVLIYATEEQQVSRVMGRDGLPRDAALARVRSQMPIEEKRAFPGVISVDNSGSWESAEKQLRELFARWSSV